MPGCSQVLRRDPAWDDPGMTIRIPSRALVVLAGPSGAGKSTWAGRWFRSNQVVASDDLRAVVGEHDADLRAGGDAFDVLDLIVERRLKRGLLTVVDTLGMDADRHETWLAMARKAKRPTHLILWDTDDKTCRSRNRSRAHPVPSKVLSAQLTKWADVRDELGEGFDAVHTVDDVAVVPDLFARAGESAAAQADDTFGIAAFSKDASKHPKNACSKEEKLFVEAEMNK